MKWNELNILDRERKILLFYNTKRIFINVKIVYERSKNLANCMTQWYTYI